MHSRGGLRWFYHHEDGHVTQVTNCDAFNLFLQSNGVDIGAPSQWCFRWTYNAATHNPIVPMSTVAVLIIRLWTVADSKIRWAYPLCHHFIHEQAAGDMGTSSKRPVNRASSIDLAWVVGLYPPDLRILCNLKFLCLAPAVYFTTTGK
jgi:hypothetical protein